MSETVHTPGPWSYRSQPHDDWGVVRAGRYWICQAKDPRAIDDETLAAHRVSKTDPWEANARLIAAAPDLLAVAQYAEAILADVFEGKVDPVTALDAISDLAKPAIAKATSVESAS